ncbi:uncharacterized protein LOC111387478 isoform X2 [Olea europaea var. sylvestris]|uniref:uncharacterized protein LOC111387478 isoform X2 n=1 Tax=Olea europaea var. sylvestris TaxID=158386 RepID=UPI000C1D3514|nr:uncharacterized protein LOC111387478 isoform X2 [Olea europaea var. sylvestris]
MPGTVQVSVLEFKGPSSSHPNLTSLKVSMGKRVFRTRDMGDFSFPLTTLRDNLVIALVDTEENEIAHTGIQTRTIIEKGCWDEIISLEGGGHVHMKLQFVLSEEDRCRIRVMRESVLKKKQDVNPSINIGHSEVTGSTSDPVEISIPNMPEVSDSRSRSINIEVISHEVVAPQGGSLAKPSTSSVHPQSDYLSTEGSTLESPIPNAADPHEGASSSSVRHGVKSKFPQVDQRGPVVELETHLPLAPIPSIPFVDQEVSSMLESESQIPETSTSATSKMQDDPIHKSEHQCPLGKTPSNVRKMISAFESNLVQIPANIGKGADIVLGVTEPSHSAQNLESSTTIFLSKRKDSKVEDISTAAQGELTVKESKKMPVEFMRPSTLGTATSSGRMNEDQLRVVQAYNSSDVLLCSSNSSAVEGVDTRTGLESSIKLYNQLASNQKTKSVEYYEKEYHSSERSGIWIFPDNTQRLCITTAGKKAMKILERRHIEARTRQEKKYSSKSQMAEKCNVPFRNEPETKMRERNFCNQQESGPESSPDDASSGLVGQKKQERRKYCLPHSRLP